MSQRVRLDLNAPTFQADFVRLETDDLRQTAKTLRKLLEMTWDAVYRDQGLKWEAIRSAKGTYTLRISQKCPGQSSCAMEGSCVFWRSMPITTVLTPRNDGGLP